MRKWLFASVLLYACQTKAIATPLQGEWVNESGSTMLISVDDQTGQLSGRYCSELGRVDPDSCHPLTGWITGDVVGFSVRFDPPGSVTTWSGQISQDSTGPYLRTMWHLSRDIPEAEEDDRLWESVISGYAVFRPKGALTPDPETRGAE